MATSNVVLPKNEYLSLKYQADAWRGVASYVAENQLAEAVLKAKSEPTLRGNLRTLIKKFK